MEPNVTNDDSNEFTEVPNKSRSRRRRNHKKSLAWSTPPTPVEYIAPDGTFEPFLLVLVGLPGSGKSTFARLLEQAMPHKFVRVNQDELKTRKRCVQKAETIMSQGLCPIIDRCNFDSQQRQTWYNLANRTRYPVDCLVLDVPVQECIRRCQSRSSHETLTPQEAPRVVGQVNHDMVSPRGQEIKMIRSLQTISNSDRYNEAIVMCLNQR